MSSCGIKFSSQKLENIEEDRPASWVPVTCAPPETPTESMEFLARSWSVSAMEISKALSDTHVEPDVRKEPRTLVEDMNASSNASKEGIPSHGSPRNSSKESEDMKELFLLHQALNPNFLTSQQILKNGEIYKGIMRGKIMKSWLKDEKELKKQETRTQNAQIHASVSVAGVAAAVAALTTLNATSSLSEISTAKNKAKSNTASAIAAAAALVASHCIGIAQDMGADHHQILAVVNSAVNARGNGDIMTLTAGAATALRGAAILKARMHRAYGGGTILFADEKIEDGKESEISNALNFVSQGGELFKRTRKGDLHLKQLSFNIDSNWQVVAKMKSKHMAGTFTKKKKCVVSGVYPDMPAWPEREREEGSEQRAYFGIKTADRIIEFECRNNEINHLWTQGILHMLQCRENIS